MVFDLTIGTERAQALQNSIQDELLKRGYSPDSDPVMAEYITIMLINNKTAEQITTELEDHASFTDWLFAEAAKKSEPQPEPSSPAAAVVPMPIPTSTDTVRRAPSGPRAGANPLYSHALNQALPSGSQSGQKRSASARSPSPSGQPLKTRRMDLPTAPRAMHGREGGGRSLLERVGGRSRGGGHGRDEIQARIDAVTNQGPGPGPEAAMMNNGFNNGMGGMMMPVGDMSAAMGGGMVNPLVLQEMMMNQMALMAQMANNMGMLNNQNQFMGPNGFPAMAGMNQDVQNVNHQQNGTPQRRGGGPAGRGRGRGGSPSAQWVAPHVAESSATPAAGSATPTPAPALVAAPTPKPATALVPDGASATARPGFVPPERPQSPSLCKFGLKCTNALCRYSHPSPVATPESGVVLSNEPCEAGVNCVDKDCIKAHVSPAAVGVATVSPKSKPEPIATPSKIPCRYGANCMRATSGCTFSHPYTPKSAAGQAQFNQQCRFGASCTRATCSYQHPPGRVLPGTFHRGLAENAPVVPVPTPETGSMGAPSPHRSVVFNKPGPTLLKKNAEGGKEKKEAAEVEAAVSLSDTKTVRATA
ncbi:hypothetical protein M0805_009556 [Coniferiporia weirii]|nr:hypothetical protein M0805_009556 [Coniferiporia weirii]